MNAYRQNAHTHSVGWSTWHFEWCTKYRYKMFKQLYIKNVCLIAIQEAAKRYGIECAQTSFTTMPELITYETKQDCLDSIVRDAYLDEVIRCGDDGFCQMAFLSLNSLKSFYRVK